MHFKCIKKKKKVPNALKKEKKKVPLIKNRQDLKFHQRFIFCIIEIYYSKFLHFRQ